jgi:hypothetical protein
MPIDPLFSQSAFDPETTELLTAAFDTAWATVQRSGSPMAADDNAQSAREHLAISILAAAQEGERDPHRLVERALSQLAQTLIPRRSFGADGSPD